MRFSSTLLLLPLLVAADQQVAFKDQAAAWFDKAKAYLPNAAAVVPNPIDAGAAQVADSRVEKINLRNWKSKLGPKLDTEEEWMVYMTGGNKSCFGRCGKVDLTWNESVPLLAALPKTASSPPLHLGFVDCDKEAVLCTGWAASLPSIYHFMVPVQSNPPSKVPLRVIPLNLTSATVADIVAIPSNSKSRYLEEEEYTGLLHPFDGIVSQFGLLEPFGYLMWGLSTIPSWAMMIGISFFSRRIMNRRMQGPQAGTPAPAAAAPAAPRPAPAAAVAQGGGRKRK
ncbi:hypothetical protein PV08_02511 [Exophiala spinifera]|uniref:Uncharacterized protein n=1 Tax=Exophiala spinifera TaxID=91928 RepID=A0A0D2BGT9_9EURO|nr:uncharacterized protein PV08_02511 [Exophiala spinifera]KIW18223.1 hypothetical protein PV08_02511 [Exophiala spinifera]